MTWRDRYRVASFRGVAFYVDSDDRNAGRRLVVHTYARRDTPYTEDLGRAPRQFHVSGFVIGPDYDIQRDRLIAALERGGAGQLVHPHYGARTVLVDGQASGLVHNDREGGMARFSLVFVEAGSRANPSRRLDTAGLLATAAAGLQAAATASAIDRLQLP